MAANGRGYPSGYENWGGCGCRPGSLIPWPEAIGMREESRAMLRSGAIFCFIAAAFGGLAGLIFGLLMRASHPEQVAVNVSVIAGFAGFCVGALKPALEAL